MQRSPLFIRVAEAVYWLGIPLILGLLVGWFRVGSADADIRLAVLGFWIAYVIACCVGCILCLWLSYLVLKPWRPPLWFITIFGIVVLGLLLLYPLNHLLEYGQLRLPAATVPMGPLRTSLDSEFAGIYLFAVLPGTAIFLGVNLAYDRILGIPRYRYTMVASETAVDKSSIAPETTEDTPAIMRRLGPKTTGTLIAMQAQEHYVMVYTENGSELINYSFGNALKDMPQNSGLRTHRSWWVSRTAVEKMDRVEGNWRLLLTNGLQVPVSRSHVNEAKRLFR